jgi:uncharacterized membrane protein
MVLCWTRISVRKLIDVGRVQQAIERAETTTSGEIRVSVAAWFWGDVERAASRAFERLGMHRTQARNGVLILVVPSRRRFAIRGDEGINARVGHAFWDDLAARMSAFFRAGEFTEGLVVAIDVVAEQLARHVPYQPGNDVNELPDEVDFSSGRS